jgi:hypothetical protein
MRAVVLGSRILMITAAKRCAGAGRVSARCGGRGRGSAPRCGATDLGVVLGIAGVQRDGLEVQRHAQVDRRHHVLQLGHDAGRVDAEVQLRVLGSCGHHLGHGCSAAPRRAGAGGWRGGRGARRVVRRSWWGGRARCAALRCQRSPPGRASGQLAREEGPARRWGGGSGRPDRGCGGRGGGGRGVLRRGRPAGWAGGQGVRRAARAAAALVFTLRPAGKPGRRGGSCLGARSRFARGGEGRHTHAQARHAPRGTQGDRQARVSDDMLLQRARPAGALGSPGACLDKHLNSGEQHILQGE